MKDAKVDSKPVLLIAEAVTLAHVARPVALARGLAARGLATVVAADPRYAAICAADELPSEPLRSIPTSRFLAALARGAPIYDLATLRAYVDDDIALLQRVRPRAVVGDFRLSLSVSARRLGIPYIAIVNAYWSPYARPRWHVPALPWARRLPPALGDLAFRAARRVAFAAHARPMEALRREHGLPGLGHDLLRVYSDGDITLYADPPQLVPLFDAPPTHRHIGPVRWEPALAPPAWWDAIARADARPIYVTLGSSGDATRLPGVVDGIARLGVPVVVASAGARLPPALPPNVHVAPYLAGESIARHCSLVVCNGGSPTSHQALAQGVPVLALPANLDQVLNSACMQDAGVGEWLRADRATPPAIERLARRMIADRDLRRAAEAIGRDIAATDPCDGLARALGELGA